MRRGSKKMEVVQMYVRGLNAFWHRSDGEVDQCPAPVSLAILLPIQQYCEYCTVQLATQIVLQHCACKYDKYDTTV